MYVGDDLIHDSWTIFTHCFVISRLCRRQITQLPGGFTTRNHPKNCRDTAFSKLPTLGTFGRWDPGIRGAFFGGGLFSAVCECWWYKYTQYIYDLIINILWCIIYIYIVYRWYRYKYIDIYIHKWCITACTSCQGEVITTKQVNMNDIHLWHRRILMECFSWLRTW